MKPASLDALATSAALGPDGGFEAGAPVITAGPGGVGTGAGALATGGDGSSAMNFPLASARSQSARVAFHWVAGEKQVSENGRPANGAFVMSVKPR